MAKAPQSTILANFEQAAKRLYAGAASPFADIFKVAEEGGGDFIEGARKRRKEGRTPIIPEGIEQVPAALYSLYKIMQPNANVPYLERAAQRMSDNDDALRRTMGIGPPQNAVDVALEVTGSLLVPGPKGMAVVRMKPTTGLSVAEKVATGTRKVATGAAKTVAESVIPFRQGTSIAKAAAVQVPLAVGISEGLDAALQSPDYQSVADMVGGPVSAMDQPLEDFIPEELKTIYQEAGVAQDDQTQADILDIAAQEQEKEAAKEYFPEDPAWKDPVITAAIFDALGIGAFGARNVARRLAGANLNPVDKLTGRGGVKDITPVGVKLQQAGVQHDASLRWAGELLYGKGSADHDKFLAKLDSVTSAPLATKTQHAMTTGEMPNSAIARNPLRATLEAIAADVDDAEWQVVTDGLLARNALEDLRNNGVQSAFNDKTPDELAAMAHRLETDPKLAPYGDLVKQHFRDLLDYSLEQGLITPRAHRELIAARPHFVHMSRNLAPDDSNSLFFSRGSTSGQTAAERNRVFSRSTEEFGGIQVGAAADPLAELPGQFNKIISQAEINRVKRDFFENAVNNAELSTVIKRLPIGETPKSMEGIHEVLDNGIKKYYKVEDSAINAALDFSPVAAKTAVSTILGVPKKIAQTFITGPGNPLFAPTSALYDTITGMALRPRGYDLGLLNEFKNKLLSQSALNNPIIKESSEWISRLDPTAWLSAPIGAVRLGYDELVGAMAHDLQARLLKSNDWFVDLIGGQQNAQVLERRLASAYNSSIKSLMDKTGATTSNQLNPQDVATQARGTVDVAPNFFARANERAYNEALEGNTSFAEATLLGSKNLFDQIRAAPLSRAYMNLVRLLHEGFRYQAFASNVGKTQTRVGPYVINDTELQQLLASQTRRISADIGQTGASQVYQEAARSAMYMNVGVQTLAEVGRKFVRQPLTTTTNLVTALTMMMGMQYLYAASDSERAKEIANLTDDEQTRTVKTPLGDIPVPPELRLIWGPLTAITNEVTGINAGQMDPNFISAFEQWIDNDFDLGETGQFSLAESAKSAINAVAPVGIGSSPVVNAIAATQGIDLAMTRFSGKPTEIQGQQISQLGGEGRLTDDAISATSQKIIQELLGTTVSDFIRSGLDADRALSGGGTLSDAARVALSRMQDNAVKQAGPLRETFFGDYERVKNINDTEFNLWYEKKQGLDKATQTLRQDVLQQFVTGADPRFALLRNSDTIDPSYANTALAPIGAVAADLTKSLRPLQLRMNELKDQTDFTKNQKLSGIEDRNIQMNDYNEERQAIAQQMLYYTQMAEDNIRQMLGDPSFSFQNFDPKTYASMPWPPLPPEPAAQPSVGQGPQ